eukprot:jgi/Botrbrau1/3264/Bobra.174_1s0035.1
MSIITFSRSARLANRLISQRCGSLTREGATQTILVQVESFKALGYDQQAISEPVTSTLAFWKSLTFRERHGWSWTDERNSPGTVPCLGHPHTQQSWRDELYRPTSLHATSVANDRVFLQPAPFARNHSRMASTTAAKEQQPDQEIEGVHKAGQGSWVDRVLPAAVRPYAHLMRLDKPIGTWLLAWPCFWSIAEAAPAGGTPDLYMLALFGSGAVLLRGAGCTINDIWDRKLDRQVERTRSRPLAAGVLSTGQAIGLLGGQLLLGLGILLQLPPYSVVLGASSLPLVFLYPLAKRVTNWPQAVLGLTFNWGALLGWSAVQGSCDWSVVLPLYIGGVFWTLVYDTIYAHQDKVDDRSVGIKSTALHFGDQTKLWLAGFAGAHMACLAASGSAADLGWPFLVGLGLGGLQLAWQIRTVDLDSPRDCMAKFVSNKWYGALLFAGIVGGRLVG